MRTKSILGVAIVCQSMGLAGCGAGDAQREEELGRTQLAIDPCDLTAPFPAPVAAFTGSTQFDGLTFSADGLTAYLSGRNAPNTSYDILVATRASTGVAFGTPTVNSTLSTTGKDDRAPFLKTNGQTLYFTLTDGDDDIVYSTWGGSSFGAPQPLTAVNNVYQDRDPYYVDAESSLYFSSEGDQSNGTKRDLYRYDGSTITELPTSPAVNDHSYDEERPVLSQDGLVLYYSSNRHGLGNDTNGDIYISTRASTNVDFGAPVNLVTLNSSGRDFPVALSPDKCTLYFATNEGTGLGSADNFQIFQTTRPTSAPSTVTLTLQITGTGSVTTSPWNCSHSGAGTGGTGTCTAVAAPNAMQTVFASSSALWTGSCTGNNGNPSTDGVLTWADGGVCTIAIQ